MPINFNILWRIYCLLIIASKCDSDWLNHLVTYIKDDLKCYQTIILTSTDSNEENISYSRFQGITEELLKSVLTGVIIFNETTTENILRLEHLSSFENPRTTTFFILLHYGNFEKFEDTKLNKSLEFMIRLSKTWSHPKCMIIHLVEGIIHYHEKLLLNMWSRNILDITILELAEEEIRAKNLVNLQKEISIVHHFNPFSNIYTKEKYSKETIWFPNKLRDLNRFSMQIAVIDFFPTIKVIRNATGHPISVSGFEIKIIDTLAKTMNFTVTLPPSEKESYGVFSCDKKTPMAVFEYNITHNQIQAFLGLGPMLVGKCKKHVLERTRNIIKGKYSALVPILPEKIQNKLLDYNIYVLIFTIILITFLLILFRLLQFKNSIWNWLSLLGIFLNMSVSIPPRKFSEQIVFVNLMLMGFFYSSTVFTAFMNISLTETSKIEFDTFESISASGIQCEIHKFVYWHLIGFNEGTAAKLLNASIKSDGKNSRENCVKRLIKYKKSCCITRDDFAKVLIEKYKDEDGQPVMKIIKEIFSESMFAIVLEPNSPYVKGFDKVIIRLQEAGMIEKWREYPQSTSKPEEEIEDDSEIEIELMNPLERLLYIVNVGLMISMMAFIAELIVAKSRLYICLRNFFYRVL